MQRLERKRVYVKVSLLKQADRIVSLPIPPPPPAPHPTPAVDLLSIASHSLGMRAGGVVLASDVVERG